MTHLGVETGETEFHLREHLPANKKKFKKSVRNVKKKDVQNIWEQYEKIKK